MQFPSILVLVVPFASQNPGELASAPLGDGLLHFEIPDVAKLLQAYPEAPLMQMLRDDAVRESVGGLLEDLDLDVAESVSRALERAGLPEALAAEPMGTMRGMLDQLSSLSMSMSLTGPTGQVARDMGASLEAALRIQELVEKARAHAAANEGFPPADVAEMDVPESWRVDPWGQPYRIAVDMDSLEFEVVSLGADGKVGGEAFASDLSSAVPMERAIADIVWRTFDAEAKVEFTSEASALAAWDLMTQSLERELGARPDGRRELQIRGAAARVCEFPDLADSGLAPWMLAVEDGISIGVGKDSLGRALARAQTESGKLRPSENLTRLAEHLSESDGAQVASGWIELERLNTVLQSVKHAVESTSEASVNLIPLSGSGLFRMQLEGDRFVSEYAYNVSPDSAMARCAGATPVPERLWDFVPSESIGVYASSIDGRAIYDEIMRSITEVHGERPKALERLEREHGFSLEKDLIGNLGGGAAAYLLPISGVISIPGIAVVVELRDAAAFQRGLDAVLKLLEEQAGGEFSVRYRPYRDQPMWTFSFGGGGLSGPIAVSPTLTIVQNHLMVSLTSTRAKKEVKRLLGEEPQERHRLFSVRGAPPEDAGTITFMDWPSLVDGTYEGARAALTMFGGMMEEMPIDPQELPPSSTFTRFFEPSVSWTRALGPDVRLTRSESSFGPETLVGLAGGAGALVLAVQDLQRATRSPEPQVQVQVVQTLDAETEAAVEESRAAMEWLATRLEVYRIENGAYPRSLDLLTQPSTSYPKGYLDGGGMPDDGWGRPLRYEAAPDGKSFELWSLGADGANAGGRGDDVVLR